MEKRTKIIATIGPATFDKKIVEEMYNCGLDAIRINTSHGDFEQYKKAISVIRKVGDIPIILDTQGRGTRLRGESIVVEKGKTVKVGFSKKFTHFFDFDFHSKIKPGQKMLVGDGFLEFKVLRKSKDYLILFALGSGTVVDGKSVSFPGIDLGMPLLTNKDKKVLSFAKKNKIEFIALSFTQTKKDIQIVKKLLGNSETNIIAKIEDPKGVENAVDLIEHSDALMIARGDLGVELPSEKVPIIQKQLIKECNIKAKPAIVATQMLLSMVENSRPTRAETSDVANAILDGADCVMLSNETAVGKYPVKSVREMQKIALNVEPLNKNHVRNKYLTKTVEDVITKSIQNFSMHLSINKVVCITRTGFTARNISRFRISKQIIAITPDKMTQMKLKIVYGVKPILCEELPVESRILNSAKFLFNKKIIKKSDLVLFTAGIYSDKEGTSNSVQIHRMNDLIKYFKLSERKVK